MFEEFDIKDDSEKRKRWIQALSVLSSDEESMDEEYNVMLQNTCSLDRYQEIALRFPYPMLTDDSDEEKDLKYISNTFDVCGHIRKNRKWSLSDENADDSKENQSFKHKKRKNYISDSSNDKSVIEIHSTKRSSGIKVKNQNWSSSDENSDISSENQSFKHKKRKKYIRGSSNNKSVTEVHNTNLTSRNTVKKQKISKVGRNESLTKCSLSNTENSEQNIKRSSKRLTYQSSPEHSNAENGCSRKNKKLNLRKSKSLTTSLDGFIVCDEDCVWSKPRTKKRKFRKRNKKYEYYNKPSVSCKVVQPSSENPCEEQDPFNEKKNEDSEIKINKFLDSSSSDNSSEENKCSKETGEAKCKIALKRNKVSRFRRIQIVSPSSSDDEEPEKNQIAVSTIMPCKDQTESNYCIYTLNSDDPDNNIESAVPPKRKPTKNPAYKLALSSSSDDEESKKNEITISTSTSTKNTVEANKLTGDKLLQNSFLKASMTNTVVGANFKEKNSAELERKKGNDFSPELKKPSLATHNDSYPSVASPLHANSVAWRNIAKAQLKSQSRSSTHKSVVQNLKKQLVSSNIPSVEVYKQINNKPLNIGKTKNNYSLKESSGLQTKLQNLFGDSIDDTPIENASEEHSERVSSVCNNPKKTQPMKNNYTVNVNVYCTSPQASQESLVSVETKNKDQNQISLKDQNQISLNNKKVQPELDINLALLQNDDCTENHTGYSKKIRLAHPDRRDCKKQSENNQLNIKRKSKDLALKKLQDNISKFEGKEMKDNSTDCDVLGNILTQMKNNPFNVQKPLIKKTRPTAEMPGCSPLFSDPSAPLLPLQKHLVDSSIQVQQITPIKCVPTLNPNTSIARQDATQQVFPPFYSADSKDYTNTITTEKKNTINQGNSAANVNQLQLSILHQRDENTNNLKQIGTNIIEPLEKCSVMTHSVKTTNNIVLKNTDIVDGGDSSIDQSKSRLVGSSNRTATNKYKKSVKCNNASVFKSSQPEKQNLVVNETISGLKSSSSNIEDKIKDTNVNLAIETELVKVGPLLTSSGKVGNGEIRKSFACKNLQDASKGIRIKFGGQEFRLARENSVNNEHNLPSNRLSLNEISDYNAVAEEQNSDNRDDTVNEPKNISDMYDSKKTDAKTRNSAGNGAEAKKSSVIVKPANNQSNTKHLGLNNVSNFGDKGTYSSSSFVGDSGNDTSDNESTTQSCSEESSGGITNLTSNVAAVSKTNKTQPEHNNIATAIRSPTLVCLTQSLNQNTSTSNISKTLTEKELNQMNKSGNNSNSEDSVIILSSSSDSESCSNVVEEAKNFDNKNEDPTISRTGNNNNHNIEKISKSSTQRIAENNIQHATKSKNEKLIKNITKSMGNNAKNETEYSGKNKTFINSKLNIVNFAKDKGNVGEGNTENPCKNYTESSVKNISERNSKNNTENVPLISNVGKIRVKSLRDLGISGDKFQLQNALPYVGTITTLTVSDLPKNLKPRLGTSRTSTSQPVCVFSQPSVWKSNKTDVGPKTADTTTDKPSVLCSTTTAQPSVLCSTTTPKEKTVRSCQTSNNVSILPSTDLQRPILAVYRPRYPANRTTNSQTSISVATEDKAKQPQGTLECIGTVTAVSQCGSVNNPDFNLQIMLPAGEAGKSATQVIKVTQTSKESENLFFNLCDEFFTDMVYFKIPKLVDDLHLLIAYDLMKEERLKKISQLISPETIAAEKRRAEKDFSDMLKIRSQSFVPLFMTIVSKCNKVNNFKTLMLALYCRVVQHLERIDAVNGGYRYKLRFIIKNMLQKHNPMSKEDVNSVFIENDASFISNYIFIEQLLFKYDKVLEGRKILAQSVVNTASQENAALENASDRTNMLKIATAFRQDDNAGGQATTSNNYPSINMRGSSSAATSMQHHMPASKSETNNPPPINHADPQLGIGNLDSLFFNYLKNSL